MIESAEALELMPRLPGAGPLSRRSIEVAIAVAITVVLLVAGMVLMSPGATTEHSRVVEARVIAHAIEAHLSMPENDRVGGGFDGRGIGWFANETDAYYSTSIRHELVASGALASADANERHEVDYMIYECSDRYGVFVPLSSEDPDSTQALEWWIENGCVGAPLGILRGIGLPSPHLELAVKPPANAP